MRKPNKALLAPERPIRGPGPKSNAVFPAVRKCYPTDQLMHQVPEWFFRQQQPNAEASKLVSLFNDISVWWHVIGVAIIVVILIAVPADHACFSYVFAHRINNSGFSHTIF
jgi:hypothetical protein